MGEVKKFLDIEFWAENGIVYLSNDKAAAGKDYDSLSDQEKLKIFKGLPPKVFLKRAIMLGAMFLREGVSTSISPKQVHRFLQDAREVYKKAVEQGAVDSEEADEYKIKHKIYRKPQILVPGMAGSSLGEGIGNISGKNLREVLLEGFE